MQGFMPDTQFVLMHGCAFGLDTIAEEVGDELEFSILRFPPDLRRYGTPQAYWIRNQAMIDKNPRLCLAFPLGESKGTRGTMQLCEKAGITTINCTE